MASGDSGIAIRRMAGARSRLHNPEACRTMHRPCRGKAVQNCLSHS
jgi:hypothetical protein